MEHPDEATVKTLVAEGPQCYLELDDINNVAYCNKATYLATGHLLNAAAGTSGFVVLKRTHEHGGQSSFVMFATDDPILSFPWGEREG